MVSTTQTNPDPHPGYPSSEDEKRLWLQAGRFIRYPKEKPSGIDSSEWDRIRTIRADILLSLFDKKSKACSVPIRLRHAIVEGDFNLSYAVCPFEVSVRDDSTFTAEVNFSYAKFQGVLDLQTSTFAKKFNLEFATCSFDLQLDAATFEDEASFMGASVSGRLVARGAVFNSKASFGGVRCTKLGNFRLQQKDNVERATEFRGDASFLSSKWDSSIEFDGAQFSGKLDFARSTVEGNALFRPVQLKAEGKRPVRFNGPVFFTDSSIGGSAVFEEAEFEKEANYRRARFGRGLYFREAKFGADATFEDSQVGGPVGFDGAQFGGSCTFEAAQIRGNLNFRSNLEKRVQTKFLGAANFRDISIAGTANFNGAEFRAPAADLERPAADFSRAQIGGSAFFGFTGRADQPGMQSSFVGKALFDDMSVKGIIVFTGARFSDRAQFRRAQIGSSAFFAIGNIGGKIISTHFAGVSDFRECQFHGSVDFSGTYFGDDSIWDRSVLGGAAFFRPIPFELGPLPVVFAKKASFRDVQVSGLADFSGAYFREANFIRSKFGSSVFFSTATSPNGNLVSAHFEGGLRMFRCHIAGDLEMEGAEHEEAAEMESVQVQGNLLCRAAKLPDREPVRINFMKGARFFAATVGGVADFGGSDFGANANFMYMKVGGPVLFRPPSQSESSKGAHFQDADFRLIGVSGGIEFEGVTFAKKAQFSEARIADSCRFNRVDFEEGADFDRCQVKGDAFFDSDVHFFGSTSFQGARFGKQCLFTGAALRHGLNFSGARVDGLLSFANVDMSEKLTLEDTAVNAISLEFTKAGFPTQLDLKGFTYGKLSGNWKDIFRRIHGDSKGKAHLQAYSQLEKYFHSAGYDRDADEVYLARRKKEWQMLLQSVLLRRHDESDGTWFRAVSRYVSTVFNFLEDSVLRFVFNYGSPSYRLIAVAFFLFLAGVGMLCLPCAVRLGSRGIDSSDLTTWGRVSAAFGAFSASVIPGAREVTDWRPSFERIYTNGLQFTQAVAALGLVIYSCVTISLAGLAGLIKCKQG